MTFGQRYIEGPLPETVAPGGTEWGPRHLIADLPGGPYRLDGLSPEQVAALSRRWAGFILPEGTAHVAGSRVLRESPGRFRRFGLAGVELTLEARHWPEAVELAGYDLLARLDWSSARLHGTLSTSAEDPETFAGIAETLLRAAVAYRLREIGGVLLHGAAVVHSGLAYVFYGPSGSGKTTIAGNCAASGDAVVSDDLNAFVLLDGRHVVLPLPFCGDLKGPSTSRPTPVAALCRLRQATTERAVPSGTSAAVSSLFACSPFVNCDPHRTERLLEFLDGAVRRVPAMELSFMRDSLPWKALSAAGLPA